MAVFNKSGSFVKGVLGEMLCGYRFKGVLTNCRKLPLSATFCHFLLLSALFDHGALSLNRCAISLQDPAGQIVVMNEYQYDHLRPTCNLVDRDICQRSERRGP